LAVTCKESGVGGTLTTAAPTGRKALLSQQFRQFMVKRN
jgi:hypothetical protein